MTKVKGIQQLTLLAESFRNTSGLNTFFTLTFFAIYIWHDLVTFLFCNNYYLTQAGSNFFCFLTIHIFCINFYYYLFQYYRFLLFFFALSFNYFVKLLTIFASVHFQFSDLFANHSNLICMQYFVMQLPITIPEWCDDLKKKMISVCVYV